MEAAGDSGTQMHPPPPPEDTPTPTGPAINHVEATGGGDSEGGVVTPPTPIAVMVTLAGATEPVPFETVEPLPPTPPPEGGGKGGVASPPEGGDEGNVSIERAPAISKEEGTNVEHPVQASSPPVIVPPQTEANPQITTMTEVCISN